MILFCRSFLHRFSFLVLTIDSGWIQLHCSRAHYLIFVWSALNCVPVFSKKSWLKGFFLLLLSLFLSVQILFSAFPFQCRVCFEGSFACYILRVCKIQTVAVLQILLWPYCIHLPIRTCKTLWVSHRPDTLSGNVYSQFGVLLFSRHIASLKFSQTGADILQLLKLWMACLNLLVS